MFDVKLVAFSLYHMVYVRLLGSSHLYYNQFYIFTPHLDLPCNVVYYKK